MSTPAPPVRPVARTPSLLPAAVCWLALFVIGAYTGLLGLVLPDLARRSGLTLGQTGALYSALFGAGIVASALSGRVIDRAGVRLPLAAGLAIDAAGLLMLPWAGSLPALLIAGAILGVGDSAVVVASHVFIGQAYRDDEAAALNRLNVFFGVGAVLGPAAGAVVSFGGGRPTLLLVALAAVQVIGALLAAVVAGFGGGRGLVAKDYGPRPRLVRSRRLAVLAALLLVYVGLEIGLGAWTFTYARAAAGLGATAAALLTGAFWGALTAGRLLASPLLKWIAAPSLLVLGAAVAGVGVLALAIAGGRPPVLLAGILLAGVGFGPVWPGTFALAARDFPATAGSATGLLATTAAIGGLSLPWLQGRLLDRSGPGGIIAVTLAGCILLVALSVTAARGTRTPETAHRR